MTRRYKIHTIGDAAEIFKENKRLILETEYRNNMHLMSYRCLVCGHVGKVSLGKVLLGRNCPKCSAKKTADGQRYKYEDVKNFFASRGCALLEEEYKNTITKMRYICVCKRESSISYSNFKKGKRCQKCKGEKISKLKRKDDKTNELLSKKIHKALRTGFESTGKRKIMHSSKILGYGTKELRERITNHPNWEKVKDGKWQLDHIFPISAFVERGLVCPKLINDLSNLQPLSDLDNMKKSNKHDREEFDLWLKERGVET